MSYKSKIIKAAIKWTPKGLVAWVTNKVLKGIVELNDYQVDLDARKAYVQVQLVGEAEAIDVWLADFAVVKEDGLYYCFLHQAESNREWLTNLLSRFVGKSWKIPVPAQFAQHVDVIVELFSTPSVAPEEMTGEE